jgi:hypothetical protein
LPVNAESRKPLLSRAATSTTEEDLKGGVCTGNDLTRNSAFGGEYEQPLIPSYRRASGEHELCSSHVLGAAGRPAKPLAIGLSQSALGGVSPGGVPSWARPLLHYLLNRVPLSMLAGPYTNGSVMN